MIQETKKKTNTQSLHSTILFQNNHKPPEGYAAIANQYLWNDQAEPNNDAPNENTNDGYERMGGGNRLPLTSQEVAYSFQPLALPSLHRDGSLQGKEGERMTFSCVSRWKASCQSMTFYLGNLVLCRILGIWNQSRSRMIFILILSLVLFASIVDHVLESSRNMRIEDIRNILITQNISSIETIRIRGTPQHGALQWIANYDPLQLDPSDVNILIRYALGVFYYSVSTVEKDVMSWDDGTWLKGVSVCDWKGVLCHNSQDAQVIGLHLSYIQGRLPNELASLSELQWLQLGRNNQMSGTIPSEMGRLTNLVILSLGNNRLTGSIPPEVTKLTQLELLSVEHNYLNSTIPLDIGRLSNLAVLSMDHNALTGVIPPSVGRLQNLVDLRLDHNVVKGSIPFEIGLLCKYISFCMHACFIRMLLTQPLFLVI